MLSATVNNFGTAMYLQEVLSRLIHNHSWKVSEKV